MVCDRHTPTGKLKSPLVSLILEWTINAWESVKCETVKKVVKQKKCGTWNKLDGTINCAL